MRVTIDPEAVGIYVLIAVALAAGVAASYGRELEQKRTPDRGWWIRRLLLMPLLAIAATASTDLMQLRPSLAAFSAAMLSLGGYNMLCGLETKWRRRLEGIAGPLDPPSRDSSDTPS